MSDTRYTDALAKPITFPGGYTQLFFYPDGEITCAACEQIAATEREDGTAPPAVIIHWEGEPHTCRDCGKELPSEYGRLEADGESDED